MSGQPFWFLLLILLCHQQGVLGLSAYLYSRYQASWPDAKADCEHVGALLVKFDNMDELTEVISNSNQWLTDALSLFVGLSDLDVEGDFRWLDGTSVSATAMWTPGEPAGGTDENCGVLVTDALHDGNCTEPSYFICQVDEESSEAQLKQDIRSCWVANDLLRNVKGTDSESYVKCPRDKLYFSPSHWKNSKTWDEGKAYCEKANASLAKITSLDEQLMVDRFRLVKKFGYTWFGGTDVVVEGQFTWDDDAPFVWPTFLNSAAPAADNTKNCVATGGTKTWSVATCTTKYPILCEIDVAEAPNDQTCYWLISTSQSWNDHLLACQADGGTLANIRNIRQFERVKHVVELRHYYIGLLDANNDWDWLHLYGNNIDNTTGAIMTWSRWRDGQPNHSGGAQPYGFLLRQNGDHRFADANDPLSYHGLCEKTVFRFRDGEVLHADGSMTVTCHDKCPFRDGSLTKTWPCGDPDVTHGDGGCDCRKTLWKITDPGLSHLNVSVLEDDDVETCFTLGCILHIMNLFYNKSLSNDFGLEVILSPDTEHLRFDVVIVFTTTDLSSPTTTCQLMGTLSKCQHVSGAAYTCRCTGPCHVYVHFKMFQHNTAWRSVKICELKITD